MPMCVNWNSSINSNFLDCRPNILSAPFFVTSVHANHWNHYPLIEARSNRYTMSLSVSHRRASNQLSVINKIDISLLYFLLCYIYSYIYSSSLLYYTSLFFSSLLHYILLYSLLLCCIILLYFFLLCYIILFTSISRHSELII